MNEFESREWQPSHRTWRTPRDTCLRSRFEGEMADELFETRATLTRPRLTLQWWRILVTTTSTLLTTPTDRLTDRPTPARIKRGTKILGFDPMSEKKKQDFDIWSFFSWKLSATENILWYYGLTIYNFSIILLFYYFFILWKLYVHCISYLNVM